MNRREFIKYLSGAGVSVAASGWLVDRLWSMLESKELPAEAMGPGIERWVTSVCGLCPGGCGIKVRLVDNLPVKIEGNPLYPINRGGLCPAGLAGLQVLFNPDRIKGPLMRAGERGAHRWALRPVWESISWERALALLAEKLSTIRDQNHAYRVAFLDGGSRGVMAEVISRFLEAYGTPNHLRTDGRRNRALPFAMMQGPDALQNFPRTSRQAAKDLLGYDLAGGTRYVLSFGANCLETEGSPVWFARMFGEMRQGEGRPRATLVQVDSRFSITAAKADKWIPIKPGTEGALALGIAYMLIQEELYDAEFVAQYTFGFEDWVDSSGKTHVGFKTLVLSDYYPEAVSHLTGVPIGDLYFIARSFAKNAPAVAIVGEGVYAQPNGFYAAMAIHALNALVGSLERRGGVVTPSKAPYTPLPEVEKDEIALASLSELRMDEAASPLFPLATDVMPVLAENIAKGHPYPVELLLLYHCNPLFTSAEPAKMAEAFAKVPFIVSFSPFMDESARYADLILPDHTYLEKWQDDTDVPHIPFAHVGLSQPVIRPLYDTQHTGDVLIQLAHSLGGSIARALPFEDMLSAVKHALRGVFESGRGSIVGSAFEEGWLEFLAARGWQSPGYASFEDFWQQLTDKGGWFDAFLPPASISDALVTPSGKFEFYAQHLKHELEKHAAQVAQEGHTSPEFVLGEIVHRMKIEARGDTLFLPHFEPTRFTGDEDEYPYHLNVFEVNTLRGGYTANSPLLLEMVGFRHYVRWDSWVEIHPDTARHLGVGDGDWVWIESPVGKVKTRAKLFAGAMPGVVNMPLGLGHTALGRYAQGRGVNPLHIVANDFDLLSGIPARLATRVKVYKA